MIRISMFFTFLCIAYVLTSTVTSETVDKNVQIAANSSNTSTLKVLDDNFSKIDNSTLYKNVTSQKFNDQRINNDKPTKINIMIEGGTVEDIKTISNFVPNIHVNKTITTVDSKNNKNTTQMEMEVDASVVPRKRVVARKGAESSAFTKDNENIFPTIPENTSKIIPPQNKNLATEPNAKVHKAISEVTLNITKTVNVAKNVTTPKPKKHKSKPTKTVAQPEEDKPLPSSSTKTSALGMPRKIDYIVPVVITMVTLPLLAVAMYILYRRGRDCWDKRHYRRMDFLIDGMYNE